jgi:hypothetical protein
VAPSWPIGWAEHNLDRKGDNCARSTGVGWQADGGRATESAFQTVETINESRATRQRDEGALDFGSPTDTSERNLLVWGDNQLVMGSLLKQYAGNIKLIYIDPPFDTGADFSVHVKVGDEAFTKLPSILEEHAYRDTWGSGQASYLTMLYERLVLIHELLSEDGALYVHLAPNVSHGPAGQCPRLPLGSELVWSTEIFFPTDLTAFTPGS